MKAAYRHKDTIAQQLSTAREDIKTKEAELADIKKQLQSIK